MREQGQDKSVPGGRLGVRQLDVIVRELEGLWTLPGVVKRLAALASRARSDASRGREEALAGIVALVRLDPALTANVFRQAGRLATGEVRTINQAAAVLPSECLLATVLSSRVVRPADGSEPGASGFDRRGFWRHCLAVACASRRLAGEPGLNEDPEEAFVCGLLHNLGKLVLDQAMPKSFRRALEAVRDRRGDVADFERKILGTDHAVIGRRLAQHWRLPEAVQSANWLCHQPLEAMPSSLADRRLVEIVALADILAREKEIGFSGNFTFVRSSRQVAGQMGISAEALERVAAALEGEVRDCWESLGLDEDGAGICAEALAEANEELGRLNEDLHHRCERLEGRAAAFGRLGDFSRSLTADATVPEVVSRIAEAAAVALRRAPGPAERILAYAIGTEHEGVLVAAADGFGRPSLRTFRGGAGADRAAAKSVEEPAADALQRILADVEEIIEWADLAGCAHWPLLCEGRWVGGVVYPMKSPEAGQAGGEDVFEAMAEVFAQALALVRSRSRAMELSEQLASKSQVLAATQEALAEARTLAAVGEMAAGAAHEMNTPLAVVSGRAQLMREKAETAPERKVWGLIADQAQRISDIITELMDFARPPEPQVEVFDPDELLREVAEEFSSAEPAQAEPVRVDINVGEDAPPVRADRRQIRQVLLELMTNAANARHSGLEIRLGCGYDEIGEAILLTVEDNGPGMSEKTMARAFTPFFSSQQAGRRPGLGLPRAKRYVENSGGRIWIQSRLGEGTTVFVRLLPADR